MKRKQASLPHKVFRTSLLIVPTLFVFAVVQAQSLGEAGDFGTVVYGGGAVSTPILAADGTTALPGYAFSGATGTGMYRNGTTVGISVGGSSVWAVNSNSTMSIGAVGVGTGNVYLSSSGSGLAKLGDVNDNDFGRLMLGGTTASFPSLKRSSTAVAFRLADDSADAPITTANITSSGTVTSSRTTDLGWVTVSGANTACNTTCTSACVIGANTAAGFVLVNCSDATADVCICAGSS